MTAANLTVYVRPGCHLCDEALELLAEIDPVAAATATIVDIESDDELLARYLEAIPVITLDGAEISRLVPDRDGLAKALDAGKIR